LAVNAHQPLQDSRLGSPPDTQNQTGPRTESARRPSDIPQVTVTEAPNFRDQTLELPNSAYQTALSSLDEDQRNRITEQQTIRSLFEQLNRADQDHEERSLLRKGLSAVQPYLERLNATIDFVSPFASIEPVAGTALGLVKAAASVRHLLERLKPSSQL
jgi:hypothetical protein